MNVKEVTKEDVEEEELRGVFLTDFVHLEEVNGLIDRLGSVVGDQSLEEIWEDRLQYIFNQYQMQPHLLDPYLEILLQRCIKLIGRSTKIERKQSFVFRLIYLMVKTRGYKTIIRMMPHEVSDLEPVLSMLNDSTINDNENWQARYVLLLWLSIVVMIPFDMKLFDSSDNEPIALRIIKVGKTFLISKDVSQLAAAFMLSKFLSRHDNIKNGLLREIVNWALTEIKEIKMDEIGAHCFMCGLLRFLTYLYKFGKREDLLHFSTPILETNNSIDSVKWEKEILLCQLRTKLVQRIGLIFLKMKVISWRYQRGNRVLVDNLISNNNFLDGDTFNQSDLIKKQVENIEPEEDESIEISEHLPEVIDFLINSLKNYFTFVRWSAAKGIGRICSRLPKLFADDVVEAILVLFSRLESFSAWHGGCLAMAELGRRGLLLPQRLPEVLPLIVKALFYDEKSGECSYGANVRDAACYVCWSFARAYNPEEMKDHVMDVAIALIMVTLFDRQVTVRRAASAAFQENVGRQGQFPHGIDILTTCDYFAVGNISNCFLTLSVFIASYKEYVRPMIDHLVELKVGHWDYNIREMTAKALNKLLIFEPLYMVNEILPKLMKSCSGADLYKRQGSIMCVGEIIRAMEKPNDLPESLKVDIKSICNILDQRMQFRGLSGELMRRAVCHMIFCCSEVNICFHDDPIIDQWLKFINECALHKEKLVRTAAIETFPSFLKCYGVDSKGAIRMNFKNSYITNCCSEIVNTNVEYIQQTYLIILGKTPKYLLEAPILPDSNIDSIAGVLDLILQFSRIEVSKASKWGEARSCGIIALVDICESVGITNKYITKDVILKIYSTLLLGLDDYTFDSHGDIGALVREASMKALLRLTMWVTQNDSLKAEVLNERLCCEIMAKVAQQAVEKIDRVRNTAGKVFYDLIYLENSMPYIPNHEILKSIFSQQDCSTLYWAAPQLTFPLFCKLLEYEEYRYRVFLGLVVSVGGLTEKIVQHSREALHNCLKDHESDIEYMNKLSQSIIDVFNNFSQQDRVICPLLKLIDFIHNDPIYNEFIGANKSALLLVIERTKAEVNCSRDILKIKSGIEVFCTMLQFEQDISSKTLTALMVLIGHKFPIIRKHTATYIYQSLLMFDILDEEKTEEVMEILQETMWDNDLKEVREIRSRLCELFGVPSPKTITAGAK